MSESSLRVVLPYFERDIEQDEIRKPWLILLFADYTGGVYKIGASNKII